MQSDRRAATKVPTSSVASLRVELREAAALFSDVALAALEDCDAKRSGATRVQHRRWRRAFLEWLRARGKRLDEVLPGDIEAFCNREARAFRVRHCRVPADRRAWRGVIKWPIIALLRALHGRWPRVPNGEHLAALADELQRRGFNQDSKRNYVKVAKEFLLFLAARDVPLERATVTDIDAFVDRELTGYRRRHPKHRALPSWLVVRAKGAASWLLRVAVGPTVDGQDRRDPLLDGYVESLRDRGLAVLTVGSYCREAALLVEWLHGREVGFGRLEVSHLDRYLVDRSGKAGRAHIKWLAVSLRQFLAFLWRRRLTKRDLSETLKGPKVYTHEHLPAVVPREESRRLLASLEQASDRGAKRDRAILCLLSTYGLRSSEIAALRTGDIDWVREKVHVRQLKTRSTTDLPLLPHVGNALLDYLEVRPAEADCEEAFVLARAPYSRITATAVNAIVKRRRRHADLPIRRGRGPHAFRHLCATELLRQGESIKKVGDLLGHRSTSSTYGYLKLAVDDLRSVALEVPGA